MKKLILSSMIALLFTACGTGFKPDRSYMTPELIQREEQALTEALDKYNNATTDTEKAEAATSVGFRYMNLGDYDSSINYYEKVVKIDSTSFPAINNLAVMYEEMEDYDSAIKYIGDLYNLYTDNPEVNSDFVRVLVANKQFDEAQNVVEAFKKTEKATGNDGFIKSLEESIEKGRQSAM